MMPVSQARWLLDEDRVFVDPKHTLEDMYAWCSDVRWVPVDRARGLWEYHRHDVRLRGRLEDSDV